MYIHKSDSFPEVGQKGMVMDAGSVNYAAVNAFVVQTSQVSKTYPSDVRKCKFPGEKKLRYYSAYA